MLHALLVFTFSFARAASPASPPQSVAQQVAQPAAVKPVAAAAAVRAVSKADLKEIKALNTRYQSAKSVMMAVDKTLKLGLLGQEKKSNGYVWLSKGKMRMEMAGSEHTLLVVNKKNLWAVTFPASEFKGAAIQVITGATGSKAARKQAMVDLLAGGFLKHFTPTGLQVDANGAKTFFLQPDRDQTEFKRAQIRVSADMKNIESLHYWDSRDNETELEFSKTEFGKKLDNKLFDYKPPKNADVMTL